MFLCANSELRFSQFLIDEQTIRKLSGTNSPKSEGSKLIKIGK